MTYDNGELMSNGDDLIVVDNHKLIMKAFCVNIGPEITDGRIYIFGKPKYISLQDVNQLKEKGWKFIKR